MFLRTTGFALGGAGLAALVAACGGGSSSTSGDGRTLTLRMPFLQDMQVPDPDIMYEGEGLQVLRAAYESLIGYVPGTSEFRPSLAESWTVSDDQLTYTFTLRPGVKFHDGTVADAEAWVKSFERRLKVNQGPAYMVAGIKEATAKDATTLVVTLKEPNNAFLHYAACPWAMLATSPTAVAKHAQGDDLAQEWLKTNDAGTGPYVIKEFQPGSHYTLEAFPDYWGEKPYFTTIRIEITPEIATQKLQLDQGAFDLVTKGFAIPDVLSYTKNPDFKVTTTLGSVIVVLWMNPYAGPFQDKKLRQAMLTALDRKSIIQTAFQGLVEPETNFWPSNTFPEGLTPFDPPFDAGPLTALVPGLPEKKVDLAYVTSYGAPGKQIAELAQTQLAAAGLDVTVRSMSSAESFDLCNQPAEKRPDLLVSGIGGDALHLDTVLRIFLRTDAKPLNYFQWSNAGVDKAMDEAITKPTVDEMNQAYVEITKVIQDEALWVPFVRRPENVIMHSYLTGLEQDSYFPSLFTSNLLKRG